MKVLSIFSLTLLQIIRGRFLVVLGLVLLAEILGFRLLGAIQVMGPDGKSSTLDVDSWTTAALWWRQMLGFFSAFVFGLWIVPIFRRGASASLFWALPLPAHSILFSMILVWTTIDLTHWVAAVLFSNLAGGMSILPGQLHLIAPILISLSGGIQISCAIGIGVLLLGPMLCLVMSVMGVASLFAMEALLELGKHVPDVQKMHWWQTLKWIEPVLPPLGRIVSDSRNLVSESVETIGYTSASWVLWATICAVGFWGVLARPPKMRPQE